MSLTRQKKLAVLTPQVREVVKLVLNGQSNKAIAETLCCSIKTVEQHLTVAYRTFDVESRVQLVIALLKEED